MKHFKIPEPGDRAIAKNVAPAKRAVEPEMLAPADPEEREIDPETGGIVPTDTLREIERMEDEGEVSSQAARTWPGTGVVTREG